MRYGHAILWATLLSSPAYAQGVYCDGKDCHENVIIDLEKEGRDKQQFRDEVSAIGAQSPLNARPQIAAPTPYAPVAAPSIDAPKMLNNVVAQPNTVTCSTNRLGYTYCN